MCIAVYSLRFILTCGIKLHIRRIFAEAFLTAKGPVGNIYIVNRKIVVSAARTADKVRHKARICGAPQLKNRLYLRKRLLFLADSPKAIESETQKLRMLAFLR